MTNCVLDLQHKKDKVITKWVGKAWETINLKYLNFRRKLCLKTALLMTADGTDDGYIQPQGFTNYSFQNATLPWLSIYACLKNVCNNANIQCKIYSCFFYHGKYTLF